MSVGGQEMNGGREDRIRERRGGPPLARVRARQPRRTAILIGEGARRSEMRGELVAEVVKAWTDAATAWTEAATAWQTAADMARAWADVAVANEMKVRAEDARVRAGAAWADVAVAQAKAAR
jgi:hypothetical protein